MGDKNDTSSFDIKYTLLPPDLVVKLWALGLDANTSRVNIAYHAAGFTTAVSYSYGGAWAANLAYRLPSGSLSLGVSPSNSTVDLGLVYRGFNFSASDNLQKSSLSLSLSYGAPLLPFPDELAPSFRAAEAGVTRMAGSLGSALNNPLQYYGLHSDDVTAISNAVQLGQKIYSAQSKSDSVGFGLRVNYNPQSGLVIYGGVGVRF